MPEAQGGSPHPPMAFTPAAHRVLHIGLAAIFVGGLLLLLPLQLFVIGNDGAAVLERAMMPLNFDDPLLRGRPPGLSVVIWALAAFGLPLDMAAYVTMRLILVLAAMVSAGALWAMTANFASAMVAGILVTLSWFVAAGTTQISIDVAFLVPCLAMAGCAFAAWWKGRIWLAALAGGFGALALLFKEMAWLIVPVPVGIFLFTFAVQRLRTALGRGLLGFENQLKCAGAFVASLMFLYAPWPLSVLMLGEPLSRIFGGAYNWTTRAEQAGQSLVPAGTSGLDVAIEAIGYVHALFEGGALGGAFGGWLTLSAAIVALAYLAIWAFTAGPDQRPRRSLAALAWAAAFVLAFLPMIVVISFNPARTGQVYWVLWLQMLLTAGLAGWPMGVIKNIFTSTQKPPTRPLAISLIVPVLSCLAITAALVGAALLTKGPNGRTTWETHERFGFIQTPAQWSLAAPPRMGGVGGAQAKRIAQSLRADAGSLSAVISGQLSFRGVKLWLAPETPVERLEMPHLRYSTADSEQPTLDQSQWRQGPAIAVFAHRRSGTLTSGAGDAAQLALRSIHLGTLTEHLHRLVPSHLVLDRHSDILGWWVSELNPPTAGSELEPGPGPGPGSIIRLTPEFYDSLSQGGGSQGCVYMGIEVPLLIKAYASQADIPALQFAEQLTQMLNLRAEFAPVILEQAEDQGICWVSN